MKKLTSAKKVTKKVIWERKAMVDCAQGCSGTASGNKEIKEAALILR